MSSLSLVALAALPLLQAATPDEKMLSRNDWRRGIRCQENETHELMFAVKQRNVEHGGLLHEFLTKLSSPSSLAVGGNHLTFEEVGELTANRNATRTLHRFLVRAGAVITRTTPRGEYVRARATVGVWEQVFKGSTFYHYNYVQTEGQMNPINPDIIRTEAYTLPAILKSHISFVGFATQLPPRKPLSMMPKKIDDVEGLFRNGSAKMFPFASGSTTPDLLNSYYNIDSNEGSQSTSQALFESLGQYYSPSDLAAFQSKFNLPSEKVYKDVGGHASDFMCEINPNGCGEANLDVQYMMAVSQVTPTYFWYISNQDTPFLSFIEAIASSSNPPTVNSMSYGSIESEVPSSTLDAFNTEAMKLGAMGVSILVSSGDDGVANFQARSSASKCGFNPSFPASSPYVTAVGATMGPETGTEEIVCQSDKGGLITSGGGFSTYYAAPSYQADAVSTYFSTAQTPQGSGYNSNNRGYPDLAMLGHNYVVAIAGQFYQVSGTSCAAPVVAGMFALINANRAANGKGSVGFINPTLYANQGSICNDVTSGENNCCAGSGGSQVCCSDGFYAAAGWDPLTGFGSVDFSKLSQVFA